MPGSSLEDLIRSEATRFAGQMSQIVSWSQSEEDIRHECDKLIDVFVERARLPIRGKHEYGLAGGRVDSKYAGVIVEYKDPHGPNKIGETLASSGSAKLVAQLQQRFADFERVEKVPAAKLFGVGTDGRKVIYAHHGGAGFVAEPPREVTRYTIEALLRALVSLGAQGKSFSPECLASDFGAGSDVGQTGVRSLHRAISDSSSSRSQTFFQQWRILFGEVCGYDVEGGSARIKQLAEHYSLSGRANPAALLFALHTYYAIFIKFLAAEIASSFSPLGTSVIRRCSEAPSVEALAEEMTSLEHGGIWAHLGVRNFLEGDLFSWYLDCWSEETALAVRMIAQRLAEYDPATLSVDPADSRDLLKKLYQQLFPQSVRHDLGEYYTPDWLADHVLNEVGYEGNPDDRVLDPACGSGTFLVLAINRAKMWFENHRHECGYDESGLLSRILANVVGFDLNPLAVMASRTNYLLAIRDLLRFSSRVELPVYLCDSILTPAEFGGLLGQTRSLLTSVGEFIIPEEIACSNEKLSKYAEVVESCVSGGYTADEFLQRCHTEGLRLEETKLHGNLFAKLKRLEVENRNGIWARIIKNAFAPLFTQKADFVVGNPPWVGWEYLPEEYRRNTSDLWRHYGFFVHKGMKAVLPAGHLDFSSLFTYSCIDHFARKGGKLGFVVTNTLFKSKGSGMGFRRLVLPGGEELRVHSVHDLSSLEVFEGAANYTSTVVLEKGGATDFPAPYMVWSALSTKTLPTDGTLADVLKLVRIDSQAARPSSKDQPDSPWITGPPEILAVLQAVQGECAYKAHMGVTTDGADGVYLVDILESKDAHCVVRNRPDLSKRKPPEWTGSVESDLVYPVLKGGHIGRWQWTCELSILVPHSPEKPKVGLGLAEMRIRYPRAYAYFEAYKDELTRRGFLRKIGSGRPFYSLWKIGPYTFMPYKVGWRRMAGKLTAAVIASVDSRILIPTDTITFVPFTTEREAHYFCSVMNSSVIRCTIASSTGTGRGFGSPSVLDNLSIPRFQEGNSIHSRLAELSDKCHLAVDAGNKSALQELEQEVDETAARLWSLSEKQLDLVSSRAREMETPKRSRRKKGRR